MTSTQRSRAAASITGSLATLCLAQFMIALDYSIIYVALPSIASDLALDDAVAQWIVSAYTVLFAGFLLVGGRVVDRLGANRVFLTATVLFGIASLAGGLAHGGTLLLIARGAQGLAAAFLQPAVLSLLSSSYNDGRRRTQAVAIWGAVGASGLAVGVVLGGLLTAVDWRWTLLINLPIATIAVVGCVLWFRRSNRAHKSTPIPLAGSAVGTAALLLTVLTLTLAALPNRPWSLILPTAAGALIAAATFVVHEHRAATPLIEKSLRSVRTVRVGMAATAFYMASVGSEFYLVTLLLQQLNGFTPLQAGLAFLPLAGLVTAGNVVAGRTIPRFGAPVVLGAGFAISATGLGLLAGNGGHGLYVVALLPGLLLSGFGHGIIYTSMFSVGTSRLPDGAEGAAGALLTAAQYFSAAVTVAILTIVLDASPGEDRFSWAFLVTVVAAIGGISVSIRARFAIAPDRSEESNGRK